MKADTRSDIRHVIRHGQSDGGDARIDDVQARRRALDRWENEGGRADDEIVDDQRLSRSGVPNA